MCALAGVRAARAASHVISFDEAAIDEAHELDPELPTGYLLVPSQPIRAGAALGGRARPRGGPSRGRADLGLDPAPIVGAGDGLRSQVGCYVVNEPDRMQQLAAYGLWGFVTDVPDVGRAALGPRETA